jgi:G3E family GTPase
MTIRSSLTLVSGGSYEQREAAIAASLLTQSIEYSAVILEGLPEGGFALSAVPDLALHRLAPGCMCCIGNLAMRVTLNRVLRQAPKRLYLALSSAEHLTKIIGFLQQEAYQGRVYLDQDLRI